MTSDERARPTGRTVLVRSWGAAVIATVPAAASHGVAGGELVAPLVLGVAIALSAAVSAPIVGRRASRARLAVAALASQGLFHALFAMAGGAGSSPAGAGASAGAHAGHVIDLAALAAGLEAAAANAGPAPDATMLLAHLAAAALTVLGLCSAERIAREIGHAALGLARRVLALAGVAVHELPPLARGLPTTPVRPLAARAIASAPSRGPPSRALAVPLAPAI